ncbi:MAG: Rrf2 family transcriptional regulator [Holophagales bacterium]|nr:Rrf2 family transcriptional regulator [Holophagales bacterium]
MSSSTERRTLFSQTSRYALRTLAYLATHRDRWVLAREIAEGAGIPPDYLSKILARLRKRGFVVSQKGWGGGFRMKGTGGSVAISAVLETFDGKRVKDACAFGLGPCNADDPCPLHPHWERIREEYERMLTVTLRDLKHEANP